MRVGTGDSIKYILIAKRSGCQLKDQFCMILILSEDVPPISILNADSFEVIGQPEIQLLQEDKHLMRWSCMYRVGVVVMGYLNWEWRRPTSQQRYRCQ